MSPRGALHHLELWVADLAAAELSIGWLLAQLGFELDKRWPVGQSWRRGDFYVVLEAGPDVLAAAHERRSPGLNHVAFFAGSPAEVDALTEAAMAHGWRLMFADKHPYAGGPQHYAAYLENADGFEVELVAEPPGAEED